MKTSRLNTAYLYLSFWILLIMVITESISAQALFQVPLGQRQLFLDDHGVALVENITETMHSPDKKGAVIRPVPPHLSAVQTRTAPVWDPERSLWKMWDRTTPSDLRAEKKYCLGYYESSDGLHWTKPVVGMMEYNGSLDNNLVFIHDGDKYLKPDCVVYDADDPEPSRRFKAVIPSQGFAVSPDGIHWTMLDIPGVPSSDEYNFSFDEQEHLFILTVKTGRDSIGNFLRWNRSVALSTSRDFEHWTEPELILQTDELDQKLLRKHVEERRLNSSLQQTVFDNPDYYYADVYNMGVFRYEGLYIGMPAIFHATGPARSGKNTDGFHHVQLVCSYDLKTWKRLGNRKPFIGPSPLGAGAYDLTQIIGPSNAILHGDELWFYYTGIKYRSPPHRNVDSDVGAICLAILRRDGFISLDAGSKPGRIDTKLFKAPGNRLFVNIDAEGGSLTVEAVDARGEILAVSELITGDQPHCEVLWTKGTLKYNEGQTISLRFTVHNASFYSYWFTN